MAELTNMESKLGEVLGLAMAAQEATTKIGKLADEEGSSELVTTLERMKVEAREIEERGTEVAGTFDGKKTAILEQAAETKAKAKQMMSTYLDGDADALDGFEFLTMAEAGEVGHWEVLAKLSERARRDDVMSLCEWAVPLQHRHLEAARSGSLKLAAQEDPNGMAA